MARRRAVLQKLAELERGVSRAYVQAITSKKVAIGEVEAAIASGNQSRVQELLDFDDGDLDQMVEELRNAAIAGGLLELQGRSDKGINPNAQKTAEFLQACSSKLITQLREEQREAVREVLAVNEQLGLNPRATALDLAGRVTKSGSREGGIVGLNQPQAAAVANARKALASGDPQLMRGYLSNERRDRRFDHIVTSAIEAGKPVPQDELSKIVTRYQARLLQTRGETIARTETTQALNHGRQTKMEDVAARTGGEVIKTWEATSGARHSHARADGQDRPLHEPFEVGGHQLMYPGDTSLGAPPDEVINCRCSVTYSIRRKQEAA